MTAGRPAPFRPPPPPYAGRNETLGTVAVVSYFAVAVGAAGLLGAALSGMVDLLAVGPDPEAGDVLGSVAWFFGLFLAMWGPLTLLAVWTYRCARTGRALGFPSSAEPLLASIGWLLPLVGTYFPFQALRECLPPGHPRRQGLSAWFWISAVVVSGSWFFAFVSSWFGTGPFKVTIVVLVVLAARGAQEGVRLAWAIDAAHRQALGMADPDPDEAEPDELSPSGGP